MSGSPKLQVDSRTHSAEFGGEAVLEAAAIHSLCELVGDDFAEFLVEIIDVFLDDANSRMGGIAPAAASHDWDSIGKTVHALKSASANVGAVAFSNMCARIEAAARSGDERDLLDAVELLPGMYAEVEEALRGMKAQVN